MVRRVLFFVAVAALLALLLAYSQWIQQPPVVSGFIEADEIRVGSRVGGRVARVMAVEGATAEREAVLVELEPFDLYERRAEARANLEAAKADLARLVAGFREEEVAQAAALREQLVANLAKLKAGPRGQEIRAAEARLQAAEAQRNLAQQEYDRTMRLFGQGATTQAELDRVSESLNAALAMLVVRQQELALLREGTRQEELREAEARLNEAEQLYLLRSRGFRTEEVAQARARVEAAEALLASVEQQISELTIRAPTQSVVEAVDLQPGDLVAPGAPVLSLIDMENLWVRAYVPETRLYLRVGQRVPVTVSAFPGETFEGEVTFVSRQAEFTPRNVQTAEERARQVFRIKVTLREGAERLRPGMSADVLLPEP